MNFRKIFIIFVVLFCISFFGYFVSQTNYAQTTITTISGKFYKLDIVAKVGQDNLAIIDAAPTINDSGTVAFVARTDSLGEIYQIFSRNNKWPA